MTLLHIVPSLLFVLLVPLQFVRSLRVRHSRFHRWTGRLVMGLGIVIGTSALLLSASPVGGIVEATATVLFGCLFLFSLGNAWWHIRNRRVELHREWGHSHGCNCLGCRYDASDYGCLLRNQPAHGSHARTILRAGNVARVRFNLSGRRSVDPVCALG